ncbi:hypothetical protein NE237_016403 [Protea cynaroides]|uniref:Uncharacterized protein n=1 Tax=Protea cynaroides TaxID=273540 RepID=A0A9Q0HIL1_9MAGN|nr:hypothetical protein NE237_016403 [Protea cynaroides]
MLAWPPPFDALKIRSGLPDISPAISFATLFVNVSKYGYTSNLEIPVESQGERETKVWHFLRRKKEGERSHERSCWRGYNHSVSGLAVCFSPLVRPSPSSHLHQNVGLSGDVWFSSKLQLVKNLKGSFGVSPSGVESMALVIFQWSGYPTVSAACMIEILVTPLSKDFQVLMSWRFFV